MKNSTQFVLITAICFCLLLYGCSHAAKGNDGNKDQSDQLVEHEATDDSIYDMDESVNNEVDFDYYSTDMQQRLEKGIGIKFSPDKKQFLMTDIVSEFKSIYLFDEKKNQTEVFNFNEWFGDAAVRDMYELSYFWSGKSDSIYLYLPYSNETGSSLFELWEYKIGEKKWVAKDVSFLTEVTKIITYIYETNLLLVEKNKKYYFLDLDKKKLNKMSIPDRYTVLDQYEHDLLLGEYNSNKHNYSLAIFNIQDGSLENISEDHPKVIASPRFISNKNLISYLTRIEDTKNQVFYEMILFNLESKFVERFPIQSDHYISWDVNGECFFGANYFKCKNN